MALHLFATTQPLKFCVVEKISLPSLIGRNKLCWQLSKRQWELTRINKGQKEKGTSYVNFLALYFTSVQSRFSGTKFPAIFRYSHCDLCWWNGYCHTARQKLCEGSFIWKRKKKKAKSIFLGVYLNICLFKRLIPLPVFSIRWTHFKIWKNKLKTLNYILV